MPTRIFHLSLAQTDASVASESAAEANDEIKKCVAAKQWAKVDQASSKLSMAMAASKRAAENIETLQAKRKKIEGKKSNN